MKIIGLDVGTVRIGVARADSKVKIAVPAGVVTVDGTEFEQIARLGRVYDTNLFVLGLPRNNEGVETKQSEYVREFADTLKAKIPGAKVYFEDETLTSVTAEERLKKNGKSAKSKRKSGDIDAEAAVIILQDFIEHFTEKTGGKLPKEAKKQTSKAIKKNSKRRVRNIAIILASVLAFLSALFSAAAVYYNIMLGAVDESACQLCDDSGDSEEDDSCEPKDPITISIEEGSSTSEIAEELETAGLVRNAFIFQIFTKLNGYDGAYKSGKYTMSPCLSAPEIAHILVEGSVDADVFRFTILPGETITSIKAKLIEIGYDEAEVNSAFAAKYDHPVLAGRPEGASLEGYIYGDTYEFYNGETVENIIIRTLDELERVVEENDLTTAFNAKGLTLYQGITLASIVQKEARADDMPTVAQVFLSRLKIGMMLGSDVTTKYALDQVDPNREVYKYNADALKVPECHNTRLYAGLPCGPISNPGKSALLAVAHPTDTAYLFFLTGDDYMMYYSYTEQEHQQNIRNHCRELCNVAL